MMLLFVAARIRSRFSLPRSDNATFSVPPVCAALLAGAVAWDAPWAGLEGALEFGAGSAPRQAANSATAPLAATRRKAARRLMPPLGKNGWRSIRLLPP